MGLQRAARRALAKAAPRWARSRRVPVCRQPPAPPSPANARRVPARLTPPPPAGRRARRAVRRLG
eukprot:scaffold59645_cov42-Phaeocystis_antarctica.AAC.1